MNRFLIENTPIESLQVIRRQSSGDIREYLERLFCTDNLKALIGNRSTVEINHTLTAKVVRVCGIKIKGSPAIDMSVEERKGHS